MWHNYFEGNVYEINTIMRKNVNFNFNKECLYESGK